MSSFKRVLFSQLIIPAGISLLLVSCYNEPEMLGGNLIPATDIFKVRTDTSFQVSGFTVKADTFHTANPVFTILGYNQSDIFGSTKADFLTRFYASPSKKGFGKSPQLDSLVLFFSLKSYYGDKTKPLTVSVYELKDSLTLNFNGLGPVDTMYYPALLGTTVYRGEDTLKIRLANAFAQTLFDSVALSDAKVFQSKYKGLYVTCDNLAGSGGPIYYFDTKTSLGMRLHYNITDTSTRDTVIYYYIGANTPKVNHFVHDNSTASPSLKINKLNDLVNQDTVFYVQGLGGVKGIIKLDGLMQWADSMPILIHRAELVIEAENHPLMPSDSLVNSLFFYTKSAKGGEVQLLDQQMNRDGVYTKYNQSYSVNITVHLMRLLKGSSTESNIYVIPATAYTSINRTVLRSANHSRKMKVIVTYTRM